MIEKQNKAVIDRDINAKVKIWREDSNIGELIMREIYYAKEDYTEFSAFAEADRFNAACVIASQNSQTKQNLARLRYVMNTAHFIVLKGVALTNSDEAWKKIFGNIPKN